jgi:FkbM family methyltransferase
MRIFNRDVARYVRRIPEVHRYLWYLAKCFWVFKKPWPFVRAYLSASGLPAGQVDLRNGLSVLLSNHKDDVITLFLVFVREDYGKITPGSVIVDIGANIGVFALHAACRDAHTVLAYEANGEAFQRMRDNIRLNQLEHVVFPYHLAVTAHAGEKVRFPTRASVYNAILADDGAGDAEWVQTTNLSKIVEPVNQVDLLKMDCEGSEYDILLSSPGPVVRKLKEIRMEYHLGRAQEVVHFLQGHGFVLRRWNRDRDTSGSLWFDRT